MKCTDFYDKEKELKRIALRELDEALKAYGGRFRWYTEDDEPIEGLEAPCVCVFMDYGPTDIIIKEAIHDEKGWWFSGQGTDEYASDITFDEPYDISCAFQIQSITEKIPETEDVKSVEATEQEAEKPKPQVIAELSREDLKVRGFDGSKLTNGELAQIASKMGDYYLDYSYWDDMENACIFYEVPRIETEETEE